VLVISALIAHGFETTASSLRLLVAQPGLTGKSLQLFRFRCPALPEEIFLYRCRANQH
jgi:hypothetical protein